MIPLRVKICGIMTREIAECAVENGADALGFVFFSKSPRAVSPEEAGEIIKILPPFVGRTGVFVDKDLDEIRRIISISGIDTIQLHGESEIYNSSFLEKLSGVCRLPVIVALRLQRIDDNAIGSILAGWKEGSIASYLIDSLSASEYGGTGRPSVWHRIENKVTREFVRKRIIIAGGINAANVGTLLSRILPYGLDVSSGVEKERGVKDRTLIKNFMERAREAAAAYTEGGDGALY